MIINLLKPILMKKITLSFIICLTIAYSSHAQLFSDDFEDQNISDWTLLDIDGDGFIFKAYDPSVAQDGVNNYMSSESWDPTDLALSPDNYAVSVAIDVTNNIDLELMYIVGGQDPSYSAEVYTVYVSTGNTVADFMNSAITVSFNEDLGNDPAAAGAFVNRTMDLSALDGATTVYIAFRHHDVSDQFIINFDDVSLGGTLLSVDEFVSNTFSHSYNKDTDKLTLESSNSALSNVALFNILGQRVINQSLSQSNEVIDMSSLTDGIYLVKVSIQGQTQSIKIIKN